MRQYRPVPAGDLREGDKNPGTWDPWSFTSPGTAQAMAFRRHIIVTPPRLLDHCLINDGAVCLIQVPAERARDFAKPPVLTSGWAAQNTCNPSPIANSGIDFCYPAIGSAGRQA